MSSMYCDQSHLEFIMTKFGLQAFLNDRDPSAPVLTSRMNSAIVFASIDIDYYCRQRYAQTQLQGNDFVTWACAVIAAVKMIRRKQGVHAGLQAEYDEVIERLKEVRAFTTDIPDAYPMSEPGLWSSNLRVDQRFINRKVRVSYPTSTSDQSSAKPRAEDPWDIVLEP